MAAIVAGVLGIVASIIWAIYLMFDKDSNNSDYLPGLGACFGIVTGFVGIIISVLVIIIGVIWRYH